MAYVDPKIQDRFETLPINVKDEILRRDVKLYTVFDIINILETIVQEEEK